MTVNLTFICMYVCITAKGANFVNVHIWSNPVYIMSFLLDRSNTSSALSNTHKCVKKKKIDWFLLSLRMSSTYKCLVHLPTEMRTQKHRLDDWHRNPPPPQQPIKQVSSTHSLYREEKGGEECRAGGEHPGPSTSSPSELVTLIHSTLHVVCTPFWFTGHWHAQIIIAGVAEEDLLF